MNIFTQLLRSILLTCILTFTTPILIIGSIQGILLMLTYIPILTGIGHIGISQICCFLAIFGEGSIWYGMLVISATFAIVGILFDTVNFYRCQVLSGGH